MSSQQCRSHSTLALERMNILKKNTFTEDRETKINKNKKLNEMRRTWLQMQKIN